MSIVYDNTFFPVVRKTFFRHKEKPFWLEMLFVGIPVDVLMCESHFKCGHCDKKHETKHLIALSLN